jgi:hypothetical protein
VAPLARDEAVRILEEGNRAVAELLDRVSDEQFVEPATIGGGDWSARDLLGHLTTWEELALETLEEWRQGQTPRVETEIFGVDDGVDAFNATTVEAKRRLSERETRTIAERVHAMIVRDIEAMSDEEWAQRPSYPTTRRGRLGELLGSILGAPKRPFGHAFAHLEDLRAFVDSIG